MGLRFVIKYSLDAGSPVRMASNSPRAGTPLQSLSGQEQDAARFVATNDRTGPPASAWGLIRLGCFFCEEKLLGKAILRVVRA
jgi:hypothetical protein